MASAMGKSSPGLDCGTDIFIAAGTAIYDALAAKTEKINRLATSVMIPSLRRATRHPLNNGINNAKAIGNQPSEKKDLSFLPLVIPRSNRKIARKPLNRSFVKGLIPSACLALARYPIIKLPRIRRTLPLVKECFIAVLF